MAENNISIVIPTYNRSETLKRTLSHYLKQKFVKEVIVVDDGSTDNTHAMLEEITEQNKSGLLKWLRIDSKMNAAAARNRGIDMASGNFILFGEDDIIFSENYSEQLLSCINHNNASLISGRIIYMGQGEEFNGALERADQYSGPLLNMKLLYLYAWKKVEEDISMPFTHGCVLVRREVFKNCRFDENYTGNGWRDETDFQVQAGKQGHKIYLCPHTLCFHLPREKNDFGGQWAMGRLAFAGWAIKNNKYFLNKHYSYLKKAINLPYQKWQLLFFAFCDRLIFLLKSYFK